MKQKKLMKKKIVVMEKDGDGVGLDDGVRS